MLERSLLYEADGDGVGPEKIELGDGPVDMAKCSCALIVNWVGRSKVSGSVAVKRDASCLVVRAVKLL